MPSWIIQLLINLAISWGLPEVSKLILKWLPWLSADTVNKIIKIIEDALNSIHSTNSDPRLSPEEKRAAVADHKDDAHKAAKDCVGAACMSDTKGLD